MHMHMHAAHTHIPTHTHTHQDPFLVLSVYRAIQSGVYSMEGELWLAVLGLPLFRS